MGLALRNCGIVAVRHKSKGQPKHPVSRKLGTAILIFRPHCARGTVPGFIKQNVIRLFKLLAFIFQSYF